MPIEVSSVDDFLLIGSMMIIIIKIKQLSHCKLAQTYYFGNSLC